MNKKCLFFIILLIVSVILSGCGISAEQSATMTAAEWTPTLTPIPTETPTPTPTPIPISLEVRASADKAFARGYVVYLYDPQPDMVTSSNWLTTDYTIRYIVSNNASTEVAKIIDPDFPVACYIRVIYADGGEFYNTGCAEIIDWARETGIITVSSFFLSYAFNLNNPNKGVPVSLDVILVTTDIEANGGYAVVDSSKQLSNNVTISINP